MPVAATAVSTACALAIDTATAASGPPATSASTASATSRRAIVSSTATSAQACFTAWNEPIGRPNCWRSPA